MERESIVQRPAAFDWLPRGGSASCAVVVLPRCFRPRRCRRFPGVLRGPALLIAVWHAEGWLVGDPRPAFVYPFVLYVMWTQTLRRQTFQKWNSESKDFIDTVGYVAR